MEIAAKVALAKKHKSNKYLVDYTCFSNQGSVFLGHKRSAELVHSLRETSPMTNKVQGTELYPNFCNSFLILKVRQGWSFFWKMFEGKSVVVMGIKTF